MPLLERCKRVGGRRGENPKLESGKPVRYMESGSTQPPAKPPALQRCALKCIHFIFALGGYVGKLHRVTGKKPEKWGSNVTSRGALGKPNLFLRLGFCFVK